MNLQLRMLRFYFLYASWYIIFNALLTSKNFVDIESDYLDKYTSEFLFELIRSLCEKIDK